MTRNWTLVPLHRVETHNHYTHHLLWFASVNTLYTYGYRTQLSAVGHTYPVWEPSEWKYEIYLSDIGMQSGILWWSTGLNDFQERGTILAVQTFGVRALSVCRIKARCDNTCFDSSSTSALCFCVSASSNQPHSTSHHLAYTVYLFSQLCHI